MKAFCQRSGDLLKPYKALFGFKPLTDEISHVLASPENANILYPGKRPLSLEAQVSKEHNEPHPLRDMIKEDYLALPDKMVDNWQEYIVRIATKRLQP